ncbi:hypothetical protein [uncultured Duncaniella sp.]|uniref:hypothetical protein n=1 Tax=uncultured Duncaniella sp. TaxID=2768039 RepID=UPI002730FFF3|nr:hypothetical protein [uncultured Duncaniella sp.]
MRIFIKIFLIFLAISSLSLNSCNDKEDMKEDMPSRSTVEYQYPHVYDIVNNIKVDNEMCKAWDRMLSYANDMSRREIGFYIYYSDGYYWFSEWFYGPNTSYESEKSPIVKYGDVENENALCAFFHCHTPYYGVGSRGTGPSEKDIEAAQLLGVPGILYDYNAESVSWFFPYEDSLPMPYFFGDKRRPNRYY